jgi:hypothetical protein
MQTDKNVEISIIQFGETTRLVKCSVRKSGLELIQIQAQSGECITPSMLITRYIV